MTQSELVTKLSENLGITKVLAKETLEKTINTIADAIVAGEDVNLAGLGKFKVVEVAERTGTIQLGEKKGETYVAPAHKAVKFKVSAAFKEEVASI